MVVPRVIRSMGLSDGVGGGECAPGGLSWGFLLNLGRVSVGLRAPVAPHFSLRLHSKP